MLTPVLAIRGATKAFAGAVALRGADIEIGEGEIHALLGENGAGKSTLIKLLAAVHVPDSGEFVVAGVPLPQSYGPRDVYAAGVRFVHQDFGLIDTMSVAENMALVGGFVRRHGHIDHKASSDRAAEQIGRLGLTLDPRRLVGELSVAEKAIIALARAMAGNARLIVVDEVTAALPTPDVSRVHAAIRAASDRGVAFIYVSHRLEEVFQLCDRLTVLRDGCNVATAEVAAVDVDQVIAWIAGKSVRFGRSAPAAGRGAARLFVSEVGGRGLAEPIDMTIAGGEIVGVTGIIGSGYDCIGELVAGIEPSQGGRIAIDGREIVPGSTAAARVAGLEVVLGDRNKAAFAERTVRENLFADRLFRTGRLANLRGERLRSQELIKDFDVRPEKCGEVLIQSLSGGNQQKVLFARALMSEPRVLVLIDPTAGVDVGARAELHKLLRKAARGGAAILFASSDFEELVAVADRVLIIREGRIHVEVKSEDITWDRLFMEAHGGGAHGRPGLSHARGALQ